MHAPLPLFLPTVQFCNGSLCVLFNLSSCLCEVENSCDVCCNLDGTHTRARARTHTGTAHTHSSSSYTGQCQSMATQLQQLNANLSHYLVAGASCIGQTARGRRFNDGYCDQLQRCREIDPDDALVSQLLNLLRQYTSVAEWMRAMWWLVVLVCVGILIALNVIVTVCHFSLQSGRNRVSPVT